MWSELASGGRVSHDDKASGDDRKIKSMRELEQWVGQARRKQFTCAPASFKSHWRKNQGGWGGAIAPPVIRLGGGGGGGGGRAPLIFRLLYKPGGGAHPLRFALFFFICCHNQG